MRFIFLVLSVFLITACNKSEPVTIGGHSMGTTYHVILADKGVDTKKAVAVKEKVDSLLQTVNQQMSTYIKESEISRFNQLTDTIPFPVSAPFVRVLRLALQIHSESNNLFDVTVGPLVNLWGFGTKGNRTTPPKPKQIRETLKQVGSQFIEIINDSTIRKTNPHIQLDFSAIAKGYGVDAVAELLQKFGYSNFLAEIGGEVITRGSKDGVPWKIGIDRPLPDVVPGSDLEMILELHNAAMATSGDYRNYFTSGDSLYSHEIDPRNGRPVHNNMASVTVLAPSCMLADAMATAIMVMGAKKGLEWVESKPGVEVFIIIHSGKGFKEISSRNFKFPKH